jgi:DNA-binding CsgD family transcriptional regulator
VAQAVVAAGHRVDPESNRFATPADSRRDVETRLARYRLRGCRLGPDSATPEAGVLVSVDRIDTSDTPSAEGLRRRYGLTAREAQVASHLAQRLTNDEIAAALGISSHTARHHTESVLLKLGVTSRRALRQLLAS